jgi:hypothetical protein
MRVDRYTGFVLNGQPFNLAMDATNPGTVIKLGDTYNLFDPLAVRRGMQELW